MLSLSESVLFVHDGKEHGLSDDDELFVGDEGSKSVWVLSSDIVCMVPFKETRCVNSLSKHKTAGGNGPKMGLK